MDHSQLKLSFNVGTLTTRLSGARHDNSTQGDACVAVIGDQMPRPKHDRPGSNRGANCVVGRGPCMHWRVAVASKPIAAGSEC